LLWPSFLLPTTQHGAGAAPSRHQRCWARRKLHQHPIDSVASHPRSIEPASGSIYPALTTGAAACQKSSSRRSSSASRRTIPCAGSGSYTGRRDGATSSRALPSAAGSGSYTARPHMLGFFCKGGMKSYLVRTSSTASARSSTPTTAASSGRDRDV